MKHVRYERGGTNPFRCPRRGEHHSPGRGFLECPGAFWRADPAWTGSPACPYRARQYFLRRPQLRRACERTGERLAGGTLDLPEGHQLAPGTGRQDSKSLAGQEGSDYEGRDGGGHREKAAATFPRKMAMDAVFGLTCLNDVTARDLQKKDGQLTRSKSFDTFCPMGPWIVETRETGGRRIETRLNGKVVQSANTDMMVFPVSRLIAHISRFATLRPGDVIATGTPAGVGPLKAGDRVEVEIEGIGVLGNHCLAEPF